MTSLGFRSCGFWSAALAVLGVAPVAHAVQLSGRVVEVGSGQPVAQADVTFTQGAGAPGPSAVTVFSDETGAFRFPADLKELRIGSSLEAQKLGYRQITPKTALLPAGSAKVAAAAATAGKSEQHVDVTLYVEGVSNIARSAPASAWLAGLPQSQAKGILMAECADCHQFPSPRVREYVSQIEAVRGASDGDKRAVEEWRNTARHDAWRMMIAYMRSKHYSIFPDKSPMSLNAVDWSTIQNPNYNFYTHQQGEIVADYLADNLPRSMDFLSVDAYSRGAPLGVTARTVIREYALPDTSLVREAIPVADSPYIWGADTQRNRLLRLDPVTGATKWYPVAYNGSTGPHTIVGDAAGQIWVSMIDHDQFGRFDPKTEKWTLWTLRPSNLQGGGSSMASAAIVHDISIDSKGQMARDPAGYIWLTLLGTNMMGAIQPDRSEVNFYPANELPGLSPINHMLYSTVLSPDGKCAWFSQVNGSVGCFNTSTKTIDSLLPFAEGIGPRRMAIDGAANLWIPLFGSGQVLKYDTVNRKVLATYDLPDRAAAPYAAAWDERRKALWVSGANADVIYRFDPASEQFTVIPLPRQMAFVRQIGVDQKTDRLVAAYGNYPTGSGPSMVVQIDVGD